jgi:hypothetical protein
MGMSVLISQSQRAGRLRQQGVQFCFHLVVIAHELSQSSRHHIETGATGFQRVNHGQNDVLVRRESKREPHGKLVLDLRPLGDDERNEKRVLGKFFERTGTDITPCLLRPPNGYPTQAELKSMWREISARMAWRDTVTEREKLKVDFSFWRGVTREE